jgi:hypothetical protein
LIEICLAKFADDPDSLDRFAGRLSRILSGIEHVGGDQTPTGRGYMGTTYSSAFNGTRSADRRPAQDSAVSEINRKDLFKRFPMLANVKLSANGRY